MRTLWSCVLAVSLLSGCDDGGVDCSQGGTRCGEPYGVKLDSVGYLPGRAKRASFVGAPGFSVTRADGSVAFEGVAGEPVSAPDSGETLRVADFSALDEVGSFRVVTEGGAESPPFSIGNDVFVEPLRAAMLGFYGQRCGASVALEHDGKSFAHAECHEQDGAVTSQGGSEVRDVRLGWHDAGDYGKYTNNGAFSLGMMLMAWEHFAPALGALELAVPEAGGDVPDFLDECAFQLRWLFGMQLEDGSVADRVTTTQFDAMTTPPEGSLDVRKLSPPSSVATADFAAVMAMAARVYADFDADLAAQALAAAERAQAFLGEHPSELRPDLSAYTGGYQSGDADDRLWALGELWQTTGDAAHLAAFEAAAQSFHVSSNWDWADLHNLGLFSYVLSERGGRSEELVARLEGEVLQGADELAASAENHAYGRAVGETYYWGINGVVARTVINLRVAERLGGEVRYLDAAVAQLDHLLGRNFYGRSQITGIGHGAPKHPHHRPSAADGAAWPGLLVGGPHGNDDAKPAATRWVDSVDDYQTNEVAINWNAALVYALAGFVPSN
ncbi:MAG TPA: glycoside hydrolase family 9 protein [Polyangiaceae bacterium]|nr:glycoside hydrolase family 9 protein [Polyangiaceae bacterium]